MKIHFITFLLWLLFSSQLKAIANANISTQAIPAIQQAKNYRPIDHIQQYWVSEKLDGIRGYWNGKQLLTRQGNIINSPPWFTQNWPSNVMDGELWIGRNQFQQTLSCIKKSTADEQCWQQVRFMIFDLPNHAKTFTERIKVMEKIVNSTNSTYLAMIKQVKLDNIEQLTRTLDTVVANQGEGLMLHRGSAYYHVGRTDNIMKLKKHQDAEAKVIAHLPGKGKYHGMLGAIQVQTATGIIFKIGSGFSDQERVNPPAIGSIITYKFNGKTQAGIPRFARYWRVKENSMR